MSESHKEKTQKGITRRTLVATAGATLALAPMMSSLGLAQEGSASTVLITGSNRGIGLEFARQYTAAGWNVIATCRKPESADELQAIADANDNIVIEQLDVTDHARIAELANQYKDTPIDVLLNNAGIFTKREGQLLGQLDHNDMALTLEVNAYAPLFISEAFTEHVAASEQKKIVTLASGLGSIGMASKGMGGGMYPYRMSKAAVNMAMATLQNDLKDRGIIVGLLAPGMVDTKLLADSGYRGPSLTTEESAAAVIQNIEAMTMESSNQSINYNGQAIPW